MSQQLKKGLKTLLPWLALAALFVWMAAVRGTVAAADLTYNITNGDFQNYNPVRRMLAGQVPYRDFTVYLGVGELYSVAAVLLAVGNTFAGSVFAADFLTWLFYELLALAVGYVVLGRARPAAIFAAVISAIYFVRLPGKLLGIAFAVGNSARMIRFGAVPLLILLVALALRYAKHPDRWWPFLAGAFVPWSNDVGGSLYIAASLAYGLLLIRKYGKNIRLIAQKTMVYIAVSVAGLLAAVTVYTWGHPLAWLRQTRGVSADQGWYYGTTLENRMTHLWQFRPSVGFALAVGLAVVFAVALFKAKGTQALQCAGCFTLCLTTALWELLYAVGSGVRGGPQNSIMLLGLLLPAGAVWFARRLWGRRVSWVRPAAALAALGLAAFGAWQQLDMARGMTEGLTWQPELGGYLGDQAEKLETERTLTQGSAVFSTYATGLEVLTGQFQPSGTDYIIHALGDRLRVNYLTTFQNGDFAYVVTPSPKTSLYEHWARNVNWWFYRELFRYWQPVGTTYVCGGMHLIWERTGAVNDLQLPAQTTLTQLGPGRVRLTVTASSDWSGVADVTLHYALEDKKLALHHYLLAECETEHQLLAESGRTDRSPDYFLPTDRGQWDIPVTVVNGEGSVVLTATDSTLSVTDAVVTATYFDWLYFFE